MRENEEKRSKNPGFYDGLGFYKLIHEEMARIHVSAYTLDFISWMTAMRNYFYNTKVYIKNAADQKSIYAEFDKAEHALSLMQQEIDLTNRQALMNNLRRILTDLQDDLYTLTSHVHLPAHMEMDEDLKEGAFRD